MEIKQLEPKDKVLTFFGEFKSATVESAIKEIVKINISDQEYLKQCRHWATDNGQDPSPAKLTPIEFFLSTYGGACYDGLALHDVLESSNTPIEVICTASTDAVLFRVLLDMVFSVNWRLILPCNSLYNDVRALF